MTVTIQGYPGSFHEQAANEYFVRVDEFLFADSFDILASHMNDGLCQYGVMAIENNIAGTILQNYRILRDNQCYIIGEIYLRIQHCLLAKQGITSEKIKQIHSHPMAINQCLKFLKSHYAKAKLVETEDTALSAKLLAASDHEKVACIASERAANLYGLQILHRNIETIKTNYTRFFILSTTAMEVKDANKASIYLHIPDKKGELLKVLQLINNYQINMSKLQSYPVADKMREYYFHIDLEFDTLEDYQSLMHDFRQHSYLINELGKYHKANIPQIEPA